MRSQRWIFVLTLVVCLVLSGSSALAQSGKTTREAEKLAAGAVSAKQEINAALDKLKEMLVQYNAIIDGSANRKPAFKTLQGEEKTAGRMIKSAGDSVAAMNKQSEKLFAVWQADIDKISDADLKKRNQGRLDARKERYAALGELLGQAGDELSPFVTLLNDQIAFLGSDLSDDAILDLQSDAKELNEMATVMADNIAELLGTAKPAEANAEADPETEAAVAEVETEEEAAEAEVETEEEPAEAEVETAEEEPAGEDDADTETGGDDDREDGKIDKNTLVE